jgi:Flp pilus assembly protein TadG
MGTLTRIHSLARRGHRGQSLVEFALVLPIFAIMLFGIIDLGRYVFTANSLNNGAREAARFASVVNRPTECTGLSRDACATSVAQSHAWGVPANSVDVIVACERYSAGGTASNPGIANCRTDDFLTVRTEAEFTLVTPLIAQFLGDQTIVGESRVTVNQ